MPSNAAEIVARLQRTLEDNQANRESCMNQYGDLVDHVEEYAIDAAWTLGRGRKPSMLPKDAPLATLLVLKHFDSWDKHGIDLGIRSSTLEKTVYKVIDIAGDVLYEHFVKPVDMTSQNQNGVTFSNYPYALHATYV
ncbi:hypothetical protein Ae201684P_021395 [Aphanomyces euteiches]|nr:hypothetical protein Ae201684P_021395 [Aphanomyces euteiches]